MKICLLTNQRLDLDPLPDDDWPCDPRPFIPEATWSVATLEKKTSIETIKKLAKDDYDVFFNLCDGADGQDTPGIEVVQTLEELGVFFTGADSQFYEPSREYMKQISKQEGIEAPAYVLARREDDVEEAIRTLKFPMFVKHYSSYASVDLSRSSRVVSEKGLLRQVRKILKRHKGALIEEFVEGTECTVLVSENPQNPKKPIAYTPIQYDFPKGESFKHEKIKWVDYDKIDSFPVEDCRLRKQLIDLSSRFFYAIGGRGFGRCDFRIDRSGVPFLLEINPNCGVYYPQTAPGSADLCLQAEPRGHEIFTRRLIEAAMLDPKSTV